MAEVELAELLCMEEKVWQALVDGDAGADAALLAPDFVGVYPDGIAGRDAHAGQLSDGPTVERYALGMARVLPVGGDHAMLIYRARYRRVGAVADEVMYVSSLWQRHGGTWRNIFSQDTPEGSGVP